jgi:hypothetical protein
MIEELKYLLDKIGDVSGFALWIIGGFMLYKLVLYLSTAGAVVYIAKLFILKCHDAITRDKDFSVTDKLSSRFLSTQAKRDFVSLFENFASRNSSYISTHDVEKIKMAMEKGNINENN